MRADERRPEQFLDGPAEQLDTAAPVAAHGDELWDSPELLGAQESVAESKAKIMPPTFSSLQARLAHEASRLETMYFHELEQPAIIDVADDGEILGVALAEMAFERVVLRPMDDLIAQLRQFAGDPLADETIGRLELLLMLARSPGGSVPYRARIVNNGVGPYEITFRDRGNPRPEVSAAVARKGP